jgi:shikimate dehydrogenase
VSAPTGRPSRLVLLGHPVAHSLSPVFQNAALAHAGIPVRYEAADVTPDQLPAALAQLTAEGAAGNVTIPHKEAAAEACARLTAVAEDAGAVNVFWVEEGELVGDNTDVPAFDEVATALLDGRRRNARVAVLGAGGAAAAALVAASAWPGVQIRVWGRSPERAAALCARCRGGVAGVAVPASTPLEAVEGATLVVNATPIGLVDADALAMAVSHLPRGAAVLDLVYRAGETAWVRAARERGHRAADGLGMLIAQGALAFERWFGIAPDRQVMWDAVRQPVAGPGVTPH